MTESLVDFHIHTSISDCSLPLEEVMALASRQNISHLSITDHDTLKAYPKAIELGRELNITVIPGIEISAFDFKNKKKVHILGYNVDVTNKRLEEVNLQTQQKRQKAVEGMTRKTASLGYIVSEEEVAEIAGDSTNFYKQHILRLLQQKGYTADMFGPLKKELFASDGTGKAHVPMVYISAEEAIRLVSDAGGIPVMAHPGVKNNWEIIEELCEIGLKGLEVYHSGHDSQAIAKAETIADNLGLLKTAGSDFHGEYAAKEVELGYPAKLIQDFLSVL